VYCIHDRQRLRQKSRPGLGQDHSLGVPLEQRHLQISLQPGDGRAHRALYDVQPLGRE
jgi:hypothetical protein